MTSNIHGRCFETILEHGGSGTAMSTSRREFWTYWTTVPPSLLFGGKLGIDATRRMSGERERDTRPRRPR